MQYEKEQKRLKRTFKIIEKELIGIEESIDFSKNEIKKQNKEMWENAPAPSGAYDTGRLISIKAFIDELAQRNIALEFKKKRYAVLMRILKSAYFGRVDFIENNQDEKMQIYIGIGTLKDDETGQILVFDWRAPVCSLFYDSEKGPVSYSSPNGKIFGKMVLRRQYKIQYDEILYMIDAEIKIDDDMLMQMLSKSADTKMKTIVTTIQKEQNKVIRDASNDVMIAVGPAGSGKTSVALHRIAYILYKERDKLTHKDILILTPNDIFADYISMVLPQLGEENVRQTTMIGCLSSYFPQYTIQPYREYMEAMLDRRDEARNKNISIKCSFDFAKRLDAIIITLKSGFYTFKDIKVDNKVMISAMEFERLYGEESKRLSPMQKIDRIKNRIRVQIKREKMKEFDAEYKRLLNEEEYYSKMDAKRQAKANIDKMFAQVDFEISRMEQISIEKYYLDFIKSDFPELYDITKDQIDKKYLLYEDVVPLAYFMYEMGISKVANGTRHVIIDELQDHPYISIKLISKLFNEAKFTLLGDKNQSLARNIDAFDPQKHSDLFVDKRLSLVTLNRCYRSSFEIFSFCAGILPEDPYDSDAVERHGEKPQIVKLGKNKSKEVRTFAQKAFDDGYKSVAVITKTLQAAKELINDDPEVSNGFTLIDNEDVLLGKKINIIPSYYAKGLEFDCVIVPDADADVYDEDKSGRILYTVCSRALHRLIVCYSNKPARGI